MSILLSVVLVTGWVVRGSLFFHVLPQPIDSTTREVVLAPGGQVQWLTPLHGLTLTGRWRGLYHDSSRPWTPASQWSSAYLRYQARGLQMTLGRQFTFVEIGGLLDGAALRIHKNALTLNALYGYRVPFGTKRTSRWFDLGGERLWAFQVRYRLRPSWLLGLGIAQDRDTDRIYQSPVWVTFQKWGTWSSHGEISYDMDLKGFSRVRVTFAHHSSRIFWAVRYQLFDLRETLHRLGWEEEPGESEEEGEAEGHAQQRIIGIFSIPGRIPITLQGWVRFGRDFSGQGVQVQTQYRDIRFRAWLTGVSEKDVQRAMEISIQHRFTPPLWLYLGATLGTSPPWSELWVEHLQLGFRWTPLAGITVRSEFRIRSNPLLEYETSGYFYVDVPIEWRATP